MSLVRRTAVWAAGDKYEPYVGRWSRRVAAQFLPWLAVGDGKRWADVGCGTCALTQTVLATQQPAQVVGVDRSEGFLRHGRSQTKSERAFFAIADGQSLPLPDGIFDAAISGLVLNFIPQPEKMANEMARIVRSGGTCAVYLWDYRGGMEMMTYFWKTAAARDEVARDLAEGVRFPICDPEQLARLFDACGLAQIETTPIDVPTVFKDFDDYWNPFLGGQGPAPAYVMSLSEDERLALREAVREGLPVEEDGSVHLVARAWAVKGMRP